MFCTFCAVALFGSLPDDGLAFACRHALIDGLSASMSCWAVGKTVCRQVWNVVVSEGEARKETKQASAVSLAFSMATRLCCSGPKVHRFGVRAICSIASKLYWITWSNVWRTRGTASCSDWSVSACCRSVGAPLSKPFRSTWLMLSRKSSWFAFSGRPGWFCTFCAWKIILIFRFRSRTRNESSSAYISAAARDTQQNRHCEKIHVGALRRTMKQTTFMWFSIILARAQQIKRES